MEVENVIELPGEANPLTEGMLAHVLKGAASSNQQQLQTSTKQLQTWETHDHFYVYLQSIFVDQRLPLEVRHIAITQLKMGIDKYWRKTAVNAVPKADKVIIRGRLLESGIHEANSVLALQNALVVAKIVRQEFPNTWPDVFQQLASVLQMAAEPQANALFLPRALLISLHIIKELSTGRLRATKTSLQSVAPYLLRIIGTIFVDSTQQVFSGVSSNDLEDSFVQHTLERTLLGIKVIRRLIIAGYEFPNRDQEVQQFMNIIGDRFRDTLVLLYSTNTGLSDVNRALMEKHLIQFAKLHVELAQQHPIAFVLLRAPAIIEQYWHLIREFGKMYGSKPAEFAKIGTDGDADEDERHALEKVSLRGILMLRACVKLLCAPTQALKYNKDPKRDEEKDEAMTVLRDNVFTKDFVGELLTVVVQQYFVFRATDLKEWEEEPDEWEKREDGEGEDFQVSIRAASEKLYLDLAFHFKDLVIPPLLSVFQELKGKTRTHCPALDHRLRFKANPSSLILLRDSVYTAIGLGAAVFRDHIDFDGFVTTTLAQEVQKNPPGYKILRRRIAILLGQWISIKVGPQTRPTVYEIFRHLLDKSDGLNDQVVRVTAGRQLKDVVDDWGFESQAFLPYAPGILSSIMALVEEVELPETKMMLLMTVSVLVQRLEHHVSWVRTARESS